MRRIRRRLPFSSCCFPCVFSVRRAYFRDAAKPGRSWYAESSARECTVCSYSVDRLSATMCRKVGPDETSPRATVPHRSRCVPQSVQGERMMKKTRDWITAAVAIAAGLSVGSAYADTCSQLAAAGLTDASLKTALRTVVPPAGKPNGGLGFPMWLTLVDGSGIVCAVTNSLDGSAGNADVTADIWLGSRVISAQKANAANAFSNSRQALSTANLYSAVQPGGSLYGLQASNPVDGTQA